jgi:hypothetical protein
MDIGTGLFLGLLSIGLVWLYVSTRERWRWKRIALWLVGIPLVLGLGFGGWLWYQEHRESQPRLETEFWELRPGMTADEVLFRKGEPTRKPEWGWLYEAGALWYSVAIRNGKVRAIEASVRGDSTYALPSLQGIGSYSSQEDIEKKFGPPEYVSVYKDKTNRRLSYTRYGVFFSLAMNRVVGLGVTDPKGDPARYGEEDVAASEALSPKPVATGASKP